MGGSNHYSKYYNNFNWYHSQCPYLEVVLWWEGPLKEAPLYL